jgi:hypothetical protein
MDRMKLAAELVGLARKVYGGERQPVRSSIRVARDAEDHIRFLLGDYTTSARMELIDLARKHKGAPDEDEVRKALEKYLAHTKNKVNGLQAALRELGR